MRFYARNRKPRFNTEVDKNNWCACDQAIEGYTERDRDILLRVYWMRDTLADNVYEVAKAENLDQNIIWDMLKEFERTIATKRGLI